MLGMKEILLAKVDPQLHSMNSLSAKDIGQVQTAETRDEKYMYIFYYDKKGARPRACIASWAGCLL